MADTPSSPEKAIGSMAETLAKARLSADCPLATGMTLGRYRVLRPLGAGGMGEVYVAEDERLGRQVAIKVIRASNALDAAARARFEQEARAASALTHPNIVTIHDIGDAAQGPFIVMELLEGRSLRETLMDALPFDEVLRIALQMTDALAAAHERGIVHRDLKPENVFVTKNGVAKILDFGVARIRRRDSGQDGTTDPQLTIQGSAIGTIGYMAPEIITGEPADFRADIFSLGCMLYEMATGRRAFEGRNAMEILAASLREDPPVVSRVRSGLPPAFATIVEKALRKDPHSRYATTRSLRDELLALTPLAPPSSKREGPAASLPRPEFPLLGRTAELTAIRSMIIEDRARLVTLAGPGGSGKTRLALAAAEELSDWFGGRVFFVSLASVTERDLVGAAIAQALGAGDPSRAPFPAVIAALRSSESRSLLVVDNFEQVIDAASDLAQLIAACPAVTLVVTSREILHLYAERTISVPPLEVPDSDANGRSGDVLSNPAVMLFVQRARAANPALELDSQNVAAIVEICRRLDGLPLAIELAAARTRLITPRAMLTRIGERLKLLTGGARDLPGRQQTLRRTLDWSYELLSVAEQQILRRLSVFAGAFTLEQAEAVADPFGRLETDIVDGVGSLVDKSLLVRKGEEDGEPRFSMLGVVRDYAGEQLASSDEEEETKKAHAAYYVVLAEEGAQRPEENAAWLARVAREYDNIRAAVEWTTATGRTEWGLRIALGIFPYWERSEHLFEGRRRFDALLAAHGSDDLLRARALFSSAVLACTQKDFDFASRRAEESRELFRRLGDQRGVAVCSNCLGVVNTEVRRLDQASEALQEALSVWSSAADEASYARSLMNLAMVCRLKGDHEAAQRMYMETEALFRRLGDRASAAWALNHQGDVARDRNQADESYRLYTSALAAFRDLGDSWGIASSLVDIGTLARCEGRLDEAYTSYRDSLDHFARVRHTRGVARVLEAMALLAVERAQPERALTLAGAASRIRDVHGAPPSDDEKAALERGLETARRALDLEGARQPYQCGRCMGVSEAISYAVSGV